MSTQKNKKIFALATLFVLLTVICSAIAWLNPLDRLQLQFSNSLYYERPTNHPVVIVAIDDKSLSDDQGLGRFQDWSRDYYAQVIENLEKHQPASIGLDIFFRSRSQGIKSEKLQEILNSANSLQELEKFSSNNIHPEDQSLIEQIKQNNNIVLAAFAPIIDVNQLGKFVNEPVIISPHQDFLNDNIGFIQGLLDKTGVARTIILQLNESRSGFTNFSLVNVLNYLKFGTVTNYSISPDQTILNGENPLTIPTENYQFLINFTSKTVAKTSEYLSNSSLPILSFTDVYNENYPSTFDPAFLKDKIVLIGAYYGSSGDNFTTPLEPKVYMPGVLIHAQAIQTILDQAFLRNTSLPEQIALIALFIAAALAAAFQLKIRYAIPLVAALGLIYALALAPLAFRSLGLILNLVYPPLALLAAILAAYVYRYLTEFKQKNFLHYAFSKYVDSSVVDSAVNDPTKLNIGGEKRQITVMFTDIAGFTTISEQLQPQSLVALLNEYLQIMTAIVVKHGGIIDKFEGDAIMAFFEDQIPVPASLASPTNQDSHATRACRAALEMRKVLPDLQEKWRNDPPLPGGETKPQIDFRIGLSTGEAIVGNVGSENRISYTAIGDTVNLGSRLESANKKYQTHLMVSEKTYAQTADKFEYRFLDVLKVKGKNLSVKTYQLLAEKGQLSTDEVNLLNQYHQAIQFYFDRKFVEAHAALTTLEQKYPNDHLIQLYAGRCEILKRYPPQSDWDFVYSMETK